MKRIGVCFLGVLMVVCGSSCSKETSQEPSQPAAAPSQPSTPSATQPPAPASQPAQPASVPATPEPAPAPSPSPVKGGTSATEKHSLSLANYAQTGVTVTLNGAWVGQWDAHTSVPLDTVVPGKNQIDVELQDEPKNEVRLEVDAQRGGQKVNLLRLNFQGKPKGSYTYYFVAR